MSHTTLLRMLTAFILIVITTASSVHAQDLPPSAKHVIDYQRDVQPIFAKACYQCHGDKAMKGGLKLTDRAAMILGGDNGPAIVVGKSQESRLIQLVAGVEDDAIMPPAGKGAMLSEIEVGVLRAWIDQGAKWPEVLSASNNTKSNHWAFQSIIRPPLPRVKNTSWVRNPVDSFVMARLESEGLSPAIEANKTTLLRRLSLDLIGLPPSIEEIDTFLADKSPNAYETQVERLLASPQYGERWARRWLDRARYADTNGYEKDRERSIWPFRDWVIDALNRDMPFDQFTVEQIAGDLLPHASTAQRVATGFHRNTMTNEEGGIDVEEFRFASIVDRVATTGTVWLGLTIQCAQCHTHKYDPITHRDYYRFFAFLNNTDEPDVELASRSIDEHRRTIDAEARVLMRKRPSQFPTHDEALDWLSLRPNHVNSSNGSVLETKEDGLVVATGKPVEKDTYRLEFDLPTGLYSSFRLETSSDPKASEVGPGRTKHGNFVLNEFKVDLSRSTDKSLWEPVPIQKVTADVEQPGFLALNTIDRDLKTGWAVDSKPGHIRDPHQATFELASPLNVKPGDKVALTLDQIHGSFHTLGRFRVLVRKIPQINPGESEKLRSTYLESRLAAWELSQKTMDWLVLTPSRVDSLKHATMDVQVDHSVLARGDKPNNDVYTVDFDGDFQGTTAVRLEVLPDPSLPDSGPGRAPLYSVGDFILSDFRAAIVSPSEPQSLHPLPFAKASEDYSEPDHKASLAIDKATDTGWTVKGGTGKPHSAVFQFASPIAKPEPGAKLRITMRQDGIHQMTIGKFRLSLTKTPQPTPASGLPMELETLLRVPKKLRSLQQESSIRDYYLSIAPELRTWNQKIDKLLNSKPKFVTSMVLEERRPIEARITQIHKRGEFQQLGPAVEPGVPEVLPLFPSDAPRNRLGLARWLVSPENPLTARVFVNQAWQAFFGRGIVSTLDDFGIRGDKPSHPELLDWLATETMRLGWSQKSIHRLIVTSSTYRQSSQANPKLMALDPHNEKLARGPRVRVEAEMVRDIALRASGLLNLKMGGPSVFPPQPDGVTAFAYGQVGWPTSQGNDRYRRGLYTYTKRTAPYATFGLFDAPSSDTTCVRRERSNTPLQALTLLNDPVYMDASHAMALNIIKSTSNSTEAGVRLAFRLCLAREPHEAELSLTVAFFAKQLERARKGELKLQMGDSGTDSNLALRTAWTMVARAILNLDETITKE